MLDWFLNNGRKNSKRVKIPGIKKLTFRDVVIFELAAKVSEAAVRLSGCPSGSPGWLEKYQAALKDVTEGLSDAEREELAVILEDWKKNGPDAAVQARYGEQNLNSESHSNAIALATRKNVEAEP